MIDDETMISVEEFLSHMHLSLDKQSFHVCAIQAVTNIAT